jgi:hypothetical protein
VGVGVSARAVLRVSAFWRIVWNGRVSRTAHELPSFSLLLSFGVQKKKGGCGYLRFLNSWMPSIVVTYWNPFSTSLVASLTVVAPEHIHSSSERFRSCV